MLSITSGLRALWATLVPAREEDPTLVWLKSQRAVNIESFTAFNGKGIYVVTVGNVTASGPTLEEAVEECRVHITRSRRLDGQRVNLEDGRLLS